MTECPISEKCGSCQYLRLAYDKQLDLKKKHLLALVNSSGLKGITVHGVIGMDEPFAYRNKVIVAFNQKYQYGFYEENSHRIIAYQRCLLHEEESDLIIRKIQQLFRKYSVSIYDEKKDRGLIKYVMLRRAVVTKQTMVTIVATDSIFKGSKNFCNELIKEFPTVTTVVLNINKRKTSIVLGEEEKILYGKGFIVDKLCGLSYKISARSFYQINHAQCELLYQKALSLLDISGSETVVDAYCGIGTLAMSIASRVKHVTGVENNRDAVNDARDNARHNSIENANFVCDDATAYLQKLVEQQAELDILIMDPPRSGSTESFLKTATKLNPGQVLYISCNPETLIRDLRIFEKLGYKGRELYPLDMFPQTKHIESMVVLRKNS